MLRVFLQVTTIGILNNSKYIYYAFIYTNWFYSQENKNCICEIIGAATFANLQFALFCLSTLRIILLDKI